MRTAVTVAAAAMLFAAGGVAIALTSRASEPATNVTTTGTYAPATMPKPLTVQEQIDTAPILILVDDPAADARWGISAAVDAWNTATGCELFTTVVDERPHLTYRVEEVPGLKWRDLEVGGMTVYPDDDSVAFKWIRFNPKPRFLAQTGAAVHELGHTLGLKHSAIHAEVMSGRRDADRSTLSVREIRTARILHADRCGPVDPTWTPTATPIH